MKLALCILTFNEYDALNAMMPSMLEYIDKSHFDYVFAVDGGSTDGTLDLYKANNIPVLGQSKKGRGEAFRIAVKEVDADAYLFFSPDGNEDVRDFPKFRPYLEQGYDVVIASRMMKESRNEEDDQFIRLRKWVNNIFNFGANLLFRREGPYITDSINGYRAVTRDAMKLMGLDALGYTIEYQMTIRAFKHRLKIAEFATIEADRIAGFSKAKSLPTGLRFVRCFMKEIFC